MELSETEPPIGSSIVHLLAAPPHNVGVSTENRGSSALEGFSSLTDTPLAALATSARHATPKKKVRPCSTTLPRIPCLLLPWALDDDRDADTADAADAADADADTSDSAPSDRYGSRRILLQGPPQSGRTSLAMNLAYACAAAGATVAETGMGTGARDENPAAAAATAATTTSLPSCRYCFLQPCRCCNVIVYRRAAASLSSSSRPPPHGPTALPPPEAFPLLCRYSSRGYPIRDQTLREKNRRVWNTDKNEGEMELPLDPNILRRIRIQYVNSARDILQDLLGLLGKPGYEHPTRAIIIDDLDQICCGNDHEPNLTRTCDPHQGQSIWEGGDNGRASSSASSEIAISIMQTLAVAVDTSHVLQRIHGELPFVLASTSSRTKIVAPWMDTVVTLSSAASSTKAEDPPQSHWTANFRGNFGAGRMAWSAAVEYSVLNRSPEGPTIEWTKYRV